MRPDDRAVDHVGGRVSLNQLRQALQHSVEDTDLHPAPVAAEDAVPFAIIIRKMPPLSARARQPHHALEIAAVILCRAAATPTLGRQQRPDHRPFIVRKTNPFAQGILQKEALNQSSSLTSTFVHEA